MLLKMNSGNGNLLLVPQNRLNSASPKLESLFLNFYQNCISSAIDNAKWKYGISYLQECRKMIPSKMNVDL